MEKKETSVGDVLLKVTDLKTYFKISDTLTVKAVEGVTFSLKKGHVLGIIGESGSGKSVTSRSIMRIVDEPGYIAGGTIEFKGENLLEVSEKRMSEIRGAEISMIFQDPTTSFNPYLTLGDQLIEAYRVHNKGASKAAAVKKAEQVLRLVGIRDCADVLRKFPCEFSAGFRQRIFIAMSMICDPDILIADEPTTSLGITIQAEIIEALSELQKETGISIMIITHDFGVVSQFSDDIFVMYAGRCVEFSPKKELLLKPAHPYTVGLIQSVPLLEERKTKRLKSISGFPPNMAKPQPGCAFAPRCPYAKDICRSEVPELKQIGEDRYCACHFPLLDYNTADDTVLE